MRERNILFSSSGLKIETVCFSEILAPIYKSTQHWNPEDHPHHSHCCKHFKSDIVKFYLLYVSEARTTRMLPKRIFYYHAEMLAA
jgi:hypothetical protein